VPYKVKVYPEFKKDREQWNAADNKRINDKITSLKEDPRPQGVEKLAGDSGNYRVRVGNFRIIYSISDEEWSAVKYPSGI
jgi:mRNA interferase RelE/StbE